MTLLLTMLPIYIFGNLHCLGMCGPLALMLGKHRFRYWYFAGRLLSFSLAGLIAGEVGAVLDVFLRNYHIGALVSFLFGGIIIISGLSLLTGIQVFQLSLGKWDQRLSQLMLRDQIWPTFLFGFFTVMLPCGQTFVVFSACALAQDAFVGLINGAAFALLTSPSLFFAMHANHFFQLGKQWGNRVLGVCALLVGMLGCFRGLAELEVIPHLVLNPNAPIEYHVVIY